MEKPILIDKNEVLNQFQHISKFSHKGIQGHALMIGGTYGKMGSVCLSAKACLKSGAGLVTVYIPKCGYEIVQIAIPEVMTLTDDFLEHITSLHFDMNFQAIGIGMGLGQHSDTQHALFHFLKNNKTPLVIDADGLNILSKNKEWLELLSQNTILTPHLKELERLIGSWENDVDKIEKVKAFSTQYNIIVVVKGAPTLIINKEIIFENTTGNQALATAGSGDVLTGIITGLLAQNYKAIDAAVLGVYLHGLTSDIAFPKTGYHSFIASDIIDYLGKAFLTLE